MQASTRWVAPEGVLGRLVAAAHERAEMLSGSRQELALRASETGPAAEFAASLRRQNVSVIAEIKRKSPSKGDINASLGASEQAKAYANGGAAAISVLTESESFGGSIEDLVSVAAAVQVPVLRKDFIVSEAQILEARVAGASAVLLIARALPPDRLVELAAFAEEWGIEVLLEVRGEAELEHALAIDGCAIGVNNRNLESLEIDPRVGERLIPRIPARRVAVYESGIASADGVRRASACGADAVLVGSALSGAPRPAELLADLTSIPRVARGNSDKVLRPDSR